MDNYVAAPFFCPTDGHEPEMLKHDKEVNIGLFEFYKESYAGSIKEITMGRVSTKAVTVRWRDQLSVLPV
jgi:CO dehydrogenase/acetyl-CoA synthase delta subunit